MRIKSRKKFIRSIAILIFILFALFSKSIANAHKEAEYIDYTISANETLWTIASKYKSPKEDIRAYIYKIKEINHLEDSNIYENQIIKIKNGQWQRRIIKALFR